MRIRISWDNGAVEAVLDATPTAEKVWAALPCTSTANTSGSNGGNTFSSLGCYIGTRPTWRSQRRIFLV